MAQNGPERAIYNNAMLRVENEKKVHENLRDGVPAPLNPTKQITLAVLTVVVAVVFGEANLEISSKCVFHIHVGLF